jgi:hypothetical protein
VKHLLEVKPPRWLDIALETRLGVGLVSNSSFLNRDVGIMGLLILNFDKQDIVSLSWFIFHFTF